MTDIAVRHGADFVAAWRSAFCHVYRWKQDGPFAVVPSLWGGRAYACVPGLSYTDLDLKAARELAAEAAGRRFNIRVLADAEGDPAPGQAMVLRVDLRAFGGDRDAIWQTALNGTCRKAVRRARKAGLTAGEERGPQALAALAELLGSVLARHGAPRLPTALLDAVTSALGGRILMVRSPRGEALAAGLWLRDGPLAWTPWTGAKRRPDAPNNLLFWTMIQQALADSASIMDFGRSAAGDSVYRFKQGFGARPVPVNWLAHAPTDLYNRYALAQRIWRGLPVTVTDRLGPKLCRYLADY